MSAEQAKHTGEQNTSEFHPKHNQTEVDLKNVHIHFHCNCNSQTEVIGQIKKLKKIVMGAQAVTQQMIEEVITLITEAFNANVGDLTEAEAEAQKADFVARVTALLNPTP